MNEDFSGVIPDELPETQLIDRDQCYADLEALQMYVVIMSAFHYLKKERDPGDVDMIGKLETRLLAALRLMRMLVEDGHERAFYESLPAYADSMAATVIIPPAYVVRETVATILASERNS